MKQLFLLIVICVQISVCQNLNSISNINDFADYLYCTKDYVRAIEEYKKILNFHHEDSIIYKIACSYLNLNNYSEAEEKFLKLNNSLLRKKSEIQLLKIKFLKNDFNFFSNSADTSDKNFESEFKKLGLLSSLKNNLKINKSFLDEFENGHRISLSNFIIEKDEMQLKSPFIAGVLSTLIPGSGKIYTSFYEDGIFSFIVVNLFGFLSYDNFSSNHSFRGWLFAAAASFFYAGNIYGSIASAQIYNSKMNLDFNSNLDRYIEKNNFFLPDNISPVCK